MQSTLKEIAHFLGGEIVGDSATVIKGIAGIREAREGDITFLANPKYLAYAKSTNASAIITSRDITGILKPVIRTDNPSLAFVKAVSFFSPPEESKKPRGIHPTAIIGEQVKLGRNVEIGAYAVIEDSASIGDDSRLYPHVFVGSGAAIGRQALIYSNVTIREDTIIGDRVIIHGGSVIGSDGFGFITVEGIHHKVPQVGIVVIENDVEIGANVTIDRARFDKTIIGEGTKIDNLVQIGHNVAIGKHCLIVAQVGISGTAEIGNHVTLAGQVGVVGHIKIGDNAIVMAGSGVSKSVPADSVVWGYPARPQEIAKRANAGVYNLHRLYETVRELKKKIEGLEKR